eukprot:EG_transcript_41145
MDIISVDAEHAAAVFAYTQDEPVPQLYSRCNEACRKAGAMAEKRIALFQDYLYHLTHALSVLPAFAGTTYRGIRTLMPPDSYALGKTVTWQAFSSTVGSRPRPTLRSSNCWMTSNRVTLATPATHTHGRPHLAPSPSWRRMGSNS